MPITFLRRRKRVLIAVASIVVIIFAPLFPYSPRCYEPSGPTTVGSVQLAPRYQAAFIANLELYEVPHLSVGRFVLLPFWTWFVNPGDWVSNASNKAVSSFVDKDFGASLDDLPRSLQSLIAETRETYGDLELVCPLVRAVAIEGF